MNILRTRPTPKPDRYNPKDEPGSIPECVDFRFEAVEPILGERMKSINQDYDMNCWPHGIALIINNVKSKSLGVKKRVGAELDQKYLVTLFKSLGYIVEVHRDTICDIMKEMKKKDHSKYDSFVCCLMSHGLKGIIAGTNMKIDEIAAHLNGDGCKSLVGKPKMFFIQASRGNYYDEEMPTSRSTGDSNIGGATLNGSSASIIPKEADFLFSFATSLGYVAHRSLHGSWYITELCRSLASYARFADLESMLVDINDKVGREYETLTLKYKEAPQYTSSLRKRVMFFPDSINAVVPKLEKFINQDYDMNCWPHGIALIISNVKNRVGAELDEDNLITIFRYLGYIVEVHRDREADTIRDIMKEMKKRDYSKYDSFVCCLMSHGSKGKIQGTDGKNVKIKEIAAHLNGDGCKSLVGKPKMFFIQACRGDSYDEGVPISSSIGGDRYLVLIILSSSQLLVHVAVLAIMVYGTACPG